MSTLHPDSVSSTPTSNNKVSNDGHFVVSKIGEFEALLLGYLFLTTKMVKGGLNAYEKSAIDRIDRERKRLGISRTMFLETVGALNLATAPEANLRTIIDKTHNQEPSDYLSIMKQYGPSDGYQYVIHLHLEDPNSSRELKKAITFLKDHRDRVLNNNHLDRGVLQNYRPPTEEIAKHEELLKQVQEGISISYRTSGSAWRFLENADSVAKHSHSLIISYPILKDLGRDIPHFLHLQAVTTWIDFLQKLHDSIVDDTSSEKPVHIDDISMTSPDDIKKSLQSMSDTMNPLLHPKAKNSQPNIKDATPRVRGPVVQTSEDKQMALIKSQYAEYLEDFEKATQKKTGWEGVKQKIRIWLRKEQDPELLIAMTEEEFIEEQKALLSAKAESVVGEVVDTSPKNKDNPTREEPEKELDVHYVDMETGVSVRLISRFDQSSTNN